ncbi:melanocortin-2 receptor accessory protein isoform X2 [Phascolarctos cinereus]|uniref:Melanocortin-2 receptor accessory protein isoform X2 n=1 Tax=Phascolarctos cinereus TaxID=38626 RepID=A0A6P5L7G9_PHACI|nr:melanocortin-2 receptor accessory protein isoform X2 [Phascolarctos cinereus]
MANRTNSTNSNSYYGYEYYMDYLDLPQVDERKLKANKYSIVIAFWVSLAAFVVLLFLILLYMSWSGSVPIRGDRSHRKCTWNHIFNMLFFVQKPRSFRISPTSTSQPQGQIKELEDGSEQPQAMVLHACFYQHEAAWIELVS